VWENREICFGLDLLKVRLVISNELSASYILLFILLLYDILREAICSTPNEVGCSLRG
jgi:hypothetical protein